ncbi:hypothetical protein BJF79_46875 [Actinomadura sp. CNU-125]|nr:hypothetical protein BJF79_46875 [Actinomadura sp. CNU-125]
MGERRRVDIAVPAHAPITEYAAMLADLCGQDETDAMPPAWSLAPVGRPPFEPGDSLGTAGVVDGETLYLRNVLDGEFDGPVVSDIEEEIAALEDDGTMWSARTRAYTTVVLGLLVLVGAAIALAAGGGAPGAIAAGVPLFATGLATPILAWSAARKHWPVPPGARTALAAAACPLLTGAVLALPTGGLRPRLAAALPRADRRARRVPRGPVGAHDGAAGRVGSRCCSPSRWRCRARTRRRRRRSWPWSCSTSSRSCRGWRRRSPHSRRAPPRWTMSRARCAASSACWSCSTPCAASRSSAASAC